MLPPLATLTVALGASLFSVALRASPAQDYMLYCMGCHGAQAQGVPGKIPPLAGALALFMRTAEGRDYVLRVPGAASSALPDAQLAAVLNWLATSYGAPGDPLPAPFTVDEVTSVRRMPLADVQVRRREVVRSLAASGAAPAAQY
ncbi:MAG TPA: cytochrome c [Steroidobacteraceae bacterium]|nr:cytochrome c [Steroidobacteraceae bacterium]